MNNTITTKRNLALVAIFTAATLVVGIFATTTTLTQTALAYSQKKKDNGKGNDNGNTVTIEECKNRGSASGFDTASDQECENLICTHPGDNATCTQEGVRSISTPTSTPTPTPEPITTTLRVITQCLCSTIFYSDSSKFPGKEQKMSFRGARHTAFYPLSG